MKGKKAVKQLWFVRRTIYGALLVSVSLLICTGTWAKPLEPLKCGAGGAATLPPTGDRTNSPKQDLLVLGICFVDGTQGSASPLLYVFHNVNIVSGGQLIFCDRFDIDFWAESILVENTGELRAVSNQCRTVATRGAVTNVKDLLTVLPFQKRLTFHLWGPASDPGITCQSQPIDGNTSPCGIPDGDWNANKLMATNMNMPMPPPPGSKQAPCTKTTKPPVPDEDCFYQYEIQDAQDKAAKRPAFFGHKVLAVSYGGKLELFGKRGVTFLGGMDQCSPVTPDTECNPAYTGTSWVRLTKVTVASDGVPTITVSRAVDWKMNDHIVVTSTDYLPSHSEEMVLMEDANGGSTFQVKNTKPGLSGFEYQHNSSIYLLPSDMPADIGPQIDRNVPDIDRAIDTRAAVGLLTRNIQIVSEGDDPSKNFSDMPSNYYYGGHTIVRQGFAGFRVQGVEFAYLGQGGAIGRYPVHFHMARKTPQAKATATDPTPSPLNYLKDCSIHDSMTRFVTIHATQGMYIARNVGFKSIGHGYYLEDATEVNNKLYANLGVLAQAAIQDEVHNPRQVPGILADKTGGPDNMPYSSDVNHPTVFWIMNGWNDFKYNMAAGAATCGACYWWLPGSNSGPSQYETWDGYASQQVDVLNLNSNLARAGVTPLKTFVGNSCVAAMNSFQMNSDTAACLGVQTNSDIKSPLSAVPSPSPKPAGGANWEIYYPVVTSLHNPALCKTPAGDCSGFSNPCDAADTYSTCTVTKLDHYTTSFNFAQTNFSAVWLRKGWDLVTNSAITDTQTGGLNFITGGGYTRSDVSLGEWLVARNTVFVGHTQPSPEDDAAANAFAMDVGPFNKFSKLACDDSSPDHCAYAKGGISFNLNPYPGQKLFNIYDGPSHQTYNAFLDINVAKMTCAPSSGGCATDPIPYGRNVGVLKDKPGTYCYLPNAAIGWKQPNGFYYPPAFHSHHLWFKNVDIRHFVVEPLFTPIKPTDTDPFQQDDEAVADRYCTSSSDMFSAAFNNIDRQTVLNDDDGTLTGLVGSQGGSKYETISINEDAYFNAPLTTPECLSDVGVTPYVKPEPFSTARTSPYQWITTAIIADCDKDKKTECRAAADQPTLWASDCGNSKCRGVPLYREYVTTAETTSARPQIRMMGQGTGQRSTLSLNHAAYYIDTTQDCTTQGGCPTCTKFNDSGFCEAYSGPYRPSVFLGGQTYHVYFVYASPTLQQSYDIYVGPGTSDAELKVTPIFVDPNGYKISTADDGSFIKPANPTNQYYDGKSLLRLKVDLTGQDSAFKASKDKFCNPKAFCSAKSDGSCGCNAAGTACGVVVTDADCAWASNDIDCPIDPMNANGMRCFGFSFTMPSNYTAKPVVPPDSLFVPFTDNPYFAKGNVTFQGSEEMSPPCVYNPPPQQQ